jgi:hypothetical protein
MNASTRPVTRLRRRLAVPCAVVAASVLASTGVAYSDDPADGSTHAVTAPEGPEADLSEHERTMAFWTPERIAAAQPVDVVLSRSTTGTTARRAEGTATKPSAPGREVRPGANATRPNPGRPGAATPVTGAHWEGGGLVQATTGFVLFENRGGLWVCSGAVIDDRTSRDDRSLIVTAGHCVFDQGDDTFHDMWMFVPDHDSAPGLLAEGCAATRYGCWTAASFVVAQEYAERGYDAVSAGHDVGIVVAGPGGHQGRALDATVGSHRLAADPIAEGTDVWSFGYPFFSPYQGDSLVYCRGSAVPDTWYVGASMGIPCDMTGGSSGGPWFTGFNPRTGRGTISSVTAYRWEPSTPDRATPLFGPLFGPAVARMYQAALIAQANTVSMTPP